MFGKKRKKQIPNNYMAQSAFTAGLAYSQMMERIDLLDSAITSDIVVNEKGQPFSVEDIIKNNKIPE